MLKVAVILAGCGRGDGSEIHEAVCCLIHLARLGAAYACFAPDIEQADVINHLTGKAMPERRNVLVESARIARGDIQPLSRLRVEDFDAVVFPGGYGAAKNLCTYARDGERCAVNPDVERVVRGFHAAGKPIGLCCIAPVIAAKVLGTHAGGPGVTVTIGDDAGTAAAIGKMGAVNTPRTATEAAVDERQRVVSTPAYMCGSASPWEVYQGIGAMMERLVAMAQSHAPRRGRQAQPA